MLKLKALIYRYTGIHLAKKEEQAHLESVDMETPMGKSIMRGLWQANNGFARPVARPLHLYRYKYPKLRPIIHLIQAVATFFVVLKYDLGRLVERISK